MPPDDRLREAIHRATKRKEWIASSQVLLAMTGGPNSRLVVARSSRAMTAGDVATNMASRSRGAKRPKFCTNGVPRKNRGSRECRVRAAPAVSCAKIVRKNAHEHTGSAETLRHPPRNGFTAYAALSPATNSSCHRHRRIRGFVAPGWAGQNLRRFDTSNGCQDHAVLPYAATRLRQKASPSIGAVVSVPGIAHGKPALRFRFAPDAAASIASRPTFVTMANAPLLGTGWGELLELICPTG
jgi:hypothetical protein